MTDWNYADVWETVADVQPSSAAVVQGSRTLPWEEFDRGADGIAQFLLDLDVDRQDKVALYLYNSPEYLQTTYAAMKVGLVPVNTNYRYGDDELSYLWDNADAVAVVFHGTFADRIERILDRVPRVKGWLWVDDGAGPCPDWATPYEDAVKSAVERTRAPWGRSGDDLYMLYTGGTTGMPKGVMWRQDDLFARLIDGGVRHYDVNAGLEGVRTALSASPGGVTLMPACPLMHGTGAFTAHTVLAEGGRVCLLESKKYDPVELLDTVEREKVNGLVIVGDPFSRPLLTALDANPGRWDLSSLMMVISSGAMWSEPVKQELLAHHPGMLLVDAFSSSEALGMGVSVSGGGSAAKTASFTLGPDVKVLTEDGRHVEPGSDEVGVLALGGRNPLGYYKDTEKSDRTFKEIDGVRYSIPGDYAQVDADGTIHLLGRGSVCINSGGEKIFPEEVEEALKTHASVRDAVVVGIPHETYGEQIVAVVEPAEGMSTESLSETELIDYVKGRLASYKAPRRVRSVPTIGRAPNGKVDYKRHRAESIEELGAAAAG
ncbi:MAG TPA: AMP-binding protein [Acidimicrobiales bacterium]|nr:AMP-binding protein [Acidimicrobiales bacterium]